MESSTKIPRFPGLLPLRRPFRRVGHRFRHPDAVHSGGDDAPGISCPLPAGIEAPEVGLQPLVPQQAHRRKRAGALPGEAHPGAARGAVPDRKYGGGRPGRGALLHLKHILAPFLFHRSRISCEGKKKCFPQELPLPAACGSEKERMPSNENRTSKSEHDLSERKAGSAKSEPVAGGAQPGRPAGTERRGQIDPDEAAGGGPHAYGRVHSGGWAAPGKGGAPAEGPAGLSAPGLRPV